MEWYCPVCGQDKLRDDTYDANYCMDCDIWLEAPCEDENCLFCASRPTHPSQVVSGPNELELEGRRSHPSGRGGGNRGDRLQPGEPAEFLPFTGNDNYIDITARLDFFDKF